MAAVAEVASLGLPVCQERIGEEVGDETPGERSQDPSSRRQYMFGTPWPTVPSVTLLLSCMSQQKQKPLCQAAVPSIHPSLHPVPGAPDLSSYKIISQIPSQTPPLPSYLSLSRHLSIFIYPVRSLVFCVLHLPYSASLPSSHPRGLPFTGPM
ncbi:hypothetical protein Q8A73_019570 [Channa argus]|nr:hypothetical protein Q8A73_019570 [Channa argus]